MPGHNNLIAINAIAVFSSIKYVNTRHWRSIMRCILTYKQIYNNKTIKLINNKNIYDNNNYNNNSNNDNNNNNNNNNNSNNNNVNNNNNNYNHDNERNSFKP